MKTEFGRAAITVRFGKTLNRAAMNSYSGCALNKGTWGDEVDGVKISVLGSAH